MKKLGIFYLSIQLLSSLFFIGCSLNGDGVSSNDDMAWAFMIIGVIVLLLSSTDKSVTGFGLLIGAVLFLIG